MIKNKKKSAVLLITVGFILILISSYFKVFPTNNFLISAFADTPIGAVLLGIGIFALFIK